LYQQNIFIKQVIEFVIYHVENNHNFPKHINDQIQIIDLKKFTFFCLFFQHFITNFPYLLNI